MDHRQVDGTYPDMNYIFFKGVSRMIQVADDMHRMADYIMDLRNMTIGLVCFSFIGAIIFLFLRHIQKRNSTDMRERTILNLRKLMQFRNGTYRSYPDPWHGSEMKSSTVILEKQLSGKTKSKATKMNHINKSPSEGMTYKLIKSKPVPKTSLNSELA